MQAQPAKAITIEQAKEYVRSTIQDMTTSLSQARQHLQEIQVSNSVQSGQVKRNLDLVDLARGQVQHIVNEYFKDVSDNYILLQSKYPSNEVKDYVLKQIDQTLIQMNEYSQKLNNHSFGMQDYTTFKTADFPRIQEEVIREAQNLEHQTQNVQKVQRLSQDSLPQVKINNRVVEGLYLALNEYASTSWLGSLSQDEYEKPTLSSPSFFYGTQVMPLPVIEDEKCSYGYYNICDASTCTLKYTFVPNDSPNYNATTVISPHGLIYLVGGVNQKGIIVSMVHVLDPVHQTISKLAPMTVKRVGASACYVPSSQPGSIGYIYVFGGRTDNNVKTKLCERYDIDRNKWEPLPKMINGKSKPACCHDAFNHCIHLFFGSDSNHATLSVVERYDLISNQWSLVEISNFLPGFNITMGAAVQISQNLILIFGGMRDSAYFKEQMYFNRKVLLFNTTNLSFLVTDWQLPVDLLPLCNPVIQNEKVYAIGTTINKMQGTFLKSVDEQPTLYLEGALVVCFDQIGPKVISYVHSYDK